MDRFSITTPIFYVNAPPHIGHAYTVVAADALARFYRLKGAAVFFLTGTDEHGAKIAEAAAAQGKSPREFADEIAETFKNAWQALDVQYDDFIRTTEPRHAEGVKRALQELHDRGFLYEKSYRGLYCTGCEKFLTEKDLVAEKAPLRPGGYVGRGKCPLHNREPELVEEKNWFFKLSEFLPRVRHAVETNVLRIVPAERRNEVLGLLTQGLEDFSVSRVRERVPWGIALPFDESQTVYVWVDALLNYLTALGYGETRNEKRETSGEFHDPHSSFLIPHSSRLCRYWPVDVHLIGQDILKFHAVYWPALLLALGQELPRFILVHGFFTVSGQKISKSLGNAIDPLDLVRRYGSDATRYLLLSQFPFGTSGDVNVARFDEQYDAVLANTIGNLVSRTITLLQKFSDSRIPDATPDRSVIANSLEWGSEGSPAVASSLDLLIREPVKLAQMLNQYADRSAPWKEADTAKRASALRTLADGVAHLALIVEPLLPRASAAIQTAFGVTNRQLPTPGTSVRPTDPLVLFPRAKDLPPIP